MSPNGERPLAADPYGHQPDGQWKLDRMESDRDMLCQVLGMEREATRAASAAFVAREHELFRFLFAMRFLDHANRNELKEDAGIFKILATIFAIEGVAPATLGNKERLVRFLARYLSREEKLTLLHGYLFTTKYPLGGERAHQRHLVFAKAIADRDFRARNFHDTDPEFCSTGARPLCFCTAWLREQLDAVVDELAGQFAEKLYEMRCAVVHEGAPVLFGGARERRPPDAAFWSFTLVDAFAVRGGGFVTYETGLLVSDLVRILANGLRRCFEDGARF